MQTKRQSLIESLANVALGYLVTLAASPLIYWICEVEINPAKMGAVTFAFTILSVIRSYAVRRLFDRINQTPVSKPTQTQ